ncbi:thioredoxin family protein [uncultured Methanobrevibacter sp.]|uniref:thioredoxin family protein n=1 Tax=uncultured Methanobrevibacter sp. TaxID=253161 RepID=UPI0026235E91|nr:thioredoxin family protein [uncultured Methanobrevibacter sp.]
MKKCSLYFIIFIIIVIIVVSAWFSLNDNKVESQKVEFNIIDTAGNLSEAIEIAKSKDKKVFAVFESDTCTYCNQLRQNTLNNNQVMEKLNESYVVTVIDINKNPEIASKYDVYSTPTMVILDSEGNELKSIVGYYGPDDLLKMI